MSEMNYEVQHGNRKRRIVVKRSVQEWAAIVSMLLVLISYLITVERRLTVNEITNQDYIEFKKRYYDQQRQHQQQQLRQFFE
jgi:hypothetical protein